MGVNVLVKSGNNVEIQDTNGMDERPIYFNRELSWLKFNERVLQEAEDPSVPLFERINFLAIFSSNLDEFFRVRVATLRNMLRLKKKERNKLGERPRRILKEIHHLVNGLQDRFGRVFRDQIIPELEAIGISIVDDTSLVEPEITWSRNVFEVHIRPFLRPIRLTDRETETPFLKNRALYMALEVRRGDQRLEFYREQPEYVLVEIPNTEIGRFVEIPVEVHGDPTRQRILFIDDLIRVHIDSMFPGDHVSGIYSIKLTRDADLDLADEYSGDLILRIKEGLKKRPYGIPSRFLYDSRMPYLMLQYLSDRLGLSEDDLIPGGRYHNINDLFQFPRAPHAHLQYEPFEPLMHPEFDDSRSILDTIEANDILLHLPYQSFDHVIRFLNVSAQDERTDHIYITLYRLASHSRIIDALIEALRRGKQVTVFVEVKARFDEESNLIWAERLELAGARVLYSLPGLKVHSKALLVTTRPMETSGIDGQSPKQYAYLSTGNFNEKTARIYTDLGLFTSDRRITTDLISFFNYLIDSSCGEAVWPDFKYLLIAPHGLRRSLYRKIDREIKNAALGKESWIIAKINALEDPKLIRRLYKASQVGVNVQLLVRGVCCLKPGLPGLSDHISVRSIVDRFLEHSRIYWFHNGGNEDVYLASADWMRRNLSERIEIAFPIFDRRLRWELWSLLNIQFNDNVKAREIDPNQTNRYIAATDEIDRAGAKIRSQSEIYRYYKTQAGSPEIP